MRMNRLFGQTLRDIPAESEIISHQLLLRAGFIRQLGAGIFSYLPLAQRSIDKIENIIREEMNAIGGQEITMPVVHPAEPWKKTGRWYQIGNEMSRFKDKSGRDMVLAMTHEEVVADLVCNEIQSYRQLPKLIYHIQTKWRDEARPRAGLIRVREFTMKDSYSLDRDWEGLDVQYRKHYQAYFNIFHRCGLQVMTVKSDVGMMGGQTAHEFMYLNPIGEDTLIVCEQCGYAANRQIALFKKDLYDEEKQLPMEKVHTPDIKTIDALAGFLKIPKYKIAKTVLMIASFAEENREDQFISAIVRGDMDVNETKLANILKVKELRPATDDEIRHVGAVPGYASPIGLKNIMVVVDDIIPKNPNLVAGANEENYHLKNVNFNRNFKADLVTDIAYAQEGNTCKECGQTLHSVRGVEMGNIFKLGARYSDSMGCKFLDKDGTDKPVIMGSYGIGSGRLLQCVAEEFNDKNGIVWPISIAPYQIHLVMLPGKGKGNEVIEKANVLYQELKASNFEVLFDDREESSGVKFNDADLIGIPIRLTISNRSLNKGGVEIKLRRSQEPSITVFEKLTSKLKSIIAELENEICELVVEHPYID